jgi:hypothetical protein
MHAAPLEDVLLLVEDALLLDDEAPLEVEDEDDAAPLDEDDALVELDAPLELEDEVVVPVPPLPASSTEEPQAMARLTKEANPSASAAVLIEVLRREAKWTQEVTRPRPTLLKRGRGRPRRVTRKPTQGRLFRLEMLCEHAPAMQAATVSHAAGVGGSLRCMDEESRSARRDRVSAQTARALRAPLLATAAGARPRPPRCARALDSRAH